MTEVREVSKFEKVGYDLLLDLITWAEISEEQVDLRGTRFESWGQWDQDLWANIENPLSSLFQINPEAMTDEERRVARNGVCKSAFCMAGQAVTQVGYRIDFGTYLDGFDTATPGTCIRQEPTGEVSKTGLPLYRDVPSAHSEEIWEVAQKELGIGEDEADALFSSNNEIHHLKHLANGFCQKRSLPLMFPDVEPWSYTDWLDER